MDGEKRRKLQDPPVMVDSIRTGYREHGLTPGVVESLRRFLAIFYTRNGRDLLWQRTTDQYRILVSEFMLRQTQVERVLVNYPAFLGRFPDIVTLARAPRALGGKLRGKVLFNRYSMFVQGEWETKFLVTGGCGFIGSHLARELANLGEVRVLDDLSSGGTWRIEDLLDRGKAQFIRGSILHRNLLADACRGVDCVFHLAAIVSVPRSMAAPLEVNEVNATGTLAVLAAAREAGVKKLVFSSTSGVYGDAPGSPKKEGTPPEPLSPYAASKLAGEYFCDVYRRSFGLPTASLRYFNVYGPGQDPRGEYASVIPKFIVQILRRSPPVIFGDGNQVRDFVFVKDVVRANILAMQRDAVGVMNIGSGDGTTIRRLAGAVMEIGGLSREPVFEKPRPGDIRESVADISRAREVMGFRPKVHLADGLEETFRWFRDHPG